MVGVARVSPFRTSYNGPSVKRQLAPTLDVSALDVLAKGAKTKKWWSFLIDYRTALLKLSRETLA